MYNKNREREKKAYAEYIFINSYFLVLLQLLLDFLKEKKIIIPYISIFF